MLESSSDWSLYADFWENIRRLEQAMKNSAELYERQVALLREQIGVLEQRRDGTADLSEWNRLGYEIFAGQIDLDFRQHEAALQRESWFVYLFALLDGFFGEWCRLYPDSPFGDDRWPPASLESLKKLPCFPRLVLSEDTVRAIVELRAKRAVFVHRRGIADRTYCDKLDRPDLLDQQLEVTQQDIGTLVDAADETVLALMSQIEPPTENAHAPP